MSESKSAPVLLKEYKRLAREDKKKLEERIRREWKKNLGPVFKLAGVPFTQKDFPRARSALYTKLTGENLELEPGEIVPGLYRNFFGFQPSPRISEQIVCKKRNQGEYKKLAELLQKREFEELLEDLNVGTEESYEQGAGSSFLAAQNRALHTVVPELLCFLQGLAKYYQDCDEERKRLGGGLSSPTIMPKLEEVKRGRSRSRSRSPGPNPRARSLSPEVMEIPTPRIKREMKRPEPPANCLRLHPRDFYLDLVLSNKPKDMQAQLALDHYDRIKTSDERNHLLQCFPELAEFIPLV